MNEKQQFKDLVLLINEEISQDMINKLDNAIKNQEIGQSILNRAKSFKIKSNPEYYIFPDFTMKSGYKKADIFEEDFSDFTDIISSSIHQIEYTYKDKALMVQYEEFKRKVQVDFLVRCGKMDFKPSSDNYFEKVITAQFEMEKHSELNSRQTKKVKPKT